MIKTFGGYSDGKDIIEHLKIELEKHGFKLQQKSEDEILKQIISNEQEEYTSISKLKTDNSGVIMARIIGNIVSGYSYQGVKIVLFFISVSGTFSNIEVTSITSDTVTEL